MSYCVRCGVELQKGCKACPLCQTEVMLPDLQDMDEGDKAFSDHIPRRVRPTLNLAPSRAFLFLMTFILMVPILVTFFVDFTSNLKITWAFYPMTSLTLIWILIAYPALLRGHTVLQVITVDIFAITLFLISLDLYSGAFFEWSQYPAVSLLLLWVYIAAPLMFTWNNPLGVFGMWVLGTAGFLVAIEKLTYAKGWLLPLGLPIVALVAVMGVIGLFIYKFSRTKPLLLVGLALFAAALFFTGTDAIVNMYIDRFNLTWSPILLAVLIPTAVFLIMVNGNPDLRAYLSKKFHV